MAAPGASLVAGEMALLVALGTTLGLVGVWAGARLLESLVYGVGVRDPVTFLAVPIVVIIPAMLATLIPASRATRVSPAEVIRTD